MMRGCLRQRSYGRVGVGLLVASRFQCQTCESLSTLCSSTKPRRGYLRRHYCTQHGHDKRKSASIRVSMRCADGGSVGSVLLEFVNSKFHKVPHVGRNREPAATIAETGLMKVLGYHHALTGHGKRTIKQHGICRSTVIFDRAPSFIVPNTIRLRYLKLWLEAEQRCFVKLPQCSPLINPIHDWGDVSCKIMF